MTDHTIFSDFLNELRVPHTPEFSDRQFRDMPFKSLFGLTKLLETYGVRSEGVRFSDKNEIMHLDVPFLAQTPGGFIIITGTDSTSGTVSYITQGVREKMPVAGFTDCLTGIVVMAYPDTESAEPDYKTHRNNLTLNVVKRWVMFLSVLFLLSYLIIVNRIYTHISSILIALFDFLGLYLTYLLVQKSINVSNPTADRVCGIIEKGGCDRVLKSGASKFFGLFGWAEVGFSYFTVSLMTLLVFPEYTMYLAMFNACCLPFTVWSIWYQKLRAGSWCTLCVSVQCTLWLLFFSYLGGGWFHGIFPIQMPAAVLGISYLTVLLLLNRILPLIEKQDPQ